ncbi:hypothetical protein D6777_04555 [Candidatus Woesearchaeota archaeon]|nr:MAG: hypothetical protein D6777_04555 [Candidatus Woesearchaeota archaeon]
MPNIAWNIARAIVTLAKRKWYFMLILFMPRTFNIAMVAVKTKLRNVKIPAQNIKGLPSIE